MYFLIFKRVVTLRGVNNLSIVWLSKNAVLKPEEVGVKAIKFLRLIKEGLPIPSGFCISGSSFEEYLKQSKTADFIVSQLFFGKNTDILKLSNQISWLISNSRLKDSLLNEIEENYEALGINERKNLKVEDLIWTGKETNVSIRPSLNDSSFSISFPNINCMRSIKNIERAIMLLYASMFSKDSLEYIKAKQKIPNISIIIQQTIIPKKAGFCSFKKGESIKIYSNFGASDSIKNGEVYPDIFEIDQSIFKIIGRKISSKNVAYLFDKTDGNIKRISIPLSERNEESLSTIEISRVYNTCKRLQESINNNFSFEWTINDYGIWILNYEVKEMEDQDVFQIIGKNEESEKENVEPKKYGDTIVYNEEKEPEKIKLFQNEENPIQDNNKKTYQDEDKTAQISESVQETKQYHQVQKEQILNEKLNEKNLEFSQELKQAFQNAIDKFSKINPHLKDMLLLFEQEVKENLKK